eukprot:GHVL01009279.1.p2 GENE.GHVL01009279.1~~GHVL01009279.1.p2  ORF type:complete len:165 (-),score=33.49 GHVL01009279.1:874-1368(-)
MASDDEAHVDFEGGESGASHTTPCQAGTLRKGGHAMLKGKPCKIMEITTSKTGKHGHAKAHIVGLDIFTGKKYEDVCPTSHNMEVPVVKRQELQLIGINDDGFIDLLNADGSTKSDLTLDGVDEDTAKQIRAYFEDGKDCLLTVQGACGHEKVIAMKEITSKDG